MDYGLARPAHRMQQEERHKALEMLDRIDRDPRCVLRLHHLHGRHGHAQSRRRDADPRVPGGGRASTPTPATTPTARGVERTEVADAGGEAGAGAADLVRAAAGDPEGAAEGRSADDD